MRSEVTLVHEETLERSPLILDKTRQHLTIHVLCEIEFCRLAKNLLIRISKSRIVFCWISVVRIIHSPLGTCSSSQLTTRCTLCKNKVILYFFLRGAILCVCLLSYMSPLVASGRSSHHLWDPPPRPAYFLDQNRGPWSQSNVRKQVPYLPEADPPPLTAIMLHSLTVQWKDIKMFYLELLSALSVPLCSLYWWTTGQKPQHVWLLIGYCTHNTVYFIILVTEFLPSWLIFFYGL